MRELPLCSTVVQSGCQPIVCLSNDQKLINKQIPLDPGGIWIPIFKPSKRMNRESSSSESQVLLPAPINAAVPVNSTPVGCIPDYGINNGDLVDANSEEFSNSTVAAIIPSKSSRRQRVWAEAACSLIACLASLMIGLIVGFSSPTLTQLDRPKHLDQRIEAGTIYASIFGALVSTGAIFGSLIAWPLSAAFGRKPALMIGGAPAFSGWLMISLSSLITNNHNAFLGVILTGRLLTGLSVGWFFFCVSVYVSEVASTKLKGLFGTCNQLFAAVGVLIAYLYGVNWKRDRTIQYWEFAIGGAVLVVIFEFLMIFTLETPRWLLSKDKDKRAVSVLHILRGPHCDISGEMEKIKSALRQKCTVKEQLSDLVSHRAVLIPFILVLMLMFFQQFSGIVPAIFYAAPILQDAGITLDVNLVSALSIGIVQVIGGLISVFFIDCVGRRILLTISGIGIVASDFVLGVYFYIYTEKCGSCLGSPAHCNLTANISNHNILVSSHDALPCNTTHFGMLAVASIVLIVFTFSLGWGPIPWNAMSELMPNRVRTLAASIATSFYWSFSTVVSLCFHSYSNWVTPAGSWWTFTLILVLAVFVVIFFLPETKGHSLEEIQEHFERGHIFAFSCRKSRSTTS